MARGARGADMPEMMPVEAIHLREEMGGVQGRGSCGPVVT